MANAGKTSVRLKTGNLYTGTVFESNPTDQKFDVKEDETGTALPGVWAANVMSGLVGIRAAHTPPVNARVLFTVVRNYAYVVGAAPVDPQFLSRKNSASGDPAADTKNTSLYAASTKYPPRNGHAPSNDLLEGELEIGNLMGVGVQFLNSLVKLQAGDLAKVEACLLNDMVRIVSQTFRHYSAFGNYEIYNDGRLNARWEGTSYDHETFGMKGEKEAKYEVDGAEIDMGKIDKLEDNFRSRFSQFIGHLGGFINMYVTDPGRALGELAEGELERSGKFRAHVGNDGTLLVQSVSEIVLERVVRIPVPRERKRWDDPAGNKATEYEGLDLAPLKKWKYDNNPANMWYAAYQMRHYARWLSSMYSLARYRQLNKDWTVPSEVSTPAPDLNSGEEDRKRADPTADYYEAYATIRIMRDGSIVNIDGYGSSVTMSAGNVQVSAAKNLTLEAAGDVNIVAGQDLNIKARRNVELVASRGGIICKARTWFHNFCEWGSYWIRSGAVDPKREEPPQPQEDDLPFDPLPIVLDQAVLIQAKQGRISQEATDGHRIVVRAHPDSEQKDATAEVYSDGVVKLSSRDSIEINCVKDLKMKASRVLVSAQEWLGSIISRFAIGHGFQVRSDGMRVDVQRLSAHMISAPTILGNKRPGGYPSHENHIGSIPEDNADAYIGEKVADADLQDAVDLRGLPPITPPTPGNGSQKPAFGVDYTPELVETNTQQQLRAAHTQEDDEYALWDWSRDRLLDFEVDSNRNKSWPGSAKESQFSTAGTDPLNEPSSRQQFDNTASGPNKAGKVFRFKKR